MNWTVLQLSFAQAVMLSVSTLLLTAAAIIGSDLSDVKSLSSLPIALMFLGTMFTTVPASLIMRKLGRKNGFLISSALGVTGGLSCYLGVTHHSFLLFCLGTTFVGVYTGFGNYYRFVAVEVASEAGKNNAISYVLAGGIIAAFVGTNLANYSKDILPIAHAGSFIAVIALYLLNTLNFILMKLPAVSMQNSGISGRPLSDIIRQPVYIVAVTSAAIGYSIMILLMTAAPLAMTHHHHAFSDVAFAIQWHVLGMFIPSFFTGHLINRFTARKVILAGSILMIGSVVCNLAGTSYFHFSLALILVGVGWNFMFIGGTSMLTETYNKQETAKAQALNDLIIFSSVTIASFGAGALQYTFGWKPVNYGVIPFVLVCIASMIWLQRRESKRSLRDG